MPSKRIIEYAINACKESTCEHQLAAILYKGGSVIRVVSNCAKTIAYRKKYFQHGEPSRHAELNAIHLIPRDVISGCSMFVVRVNKKNELRSAKPCEACAWSLFHAGIKKVYYSSYSGEILKLDFNELLSGNYAKEDFRDFLTITK